MTYPNDFVRVEMGFLITEAHDKIDDWHGWYEGIHHDLCVWLAENYGLLDDENNFPVWLCRVVEGVIKDHAEGIKDV